MSSELEGQGLLSCLPGKALVAAGMSNWTHPTQPSGPWDLRVRPQRPPCFVGCPWAYRCTSLRLSGCVGKLDPRAMLLLWVVVRTQ